MNFTVGVFTFIIFLYKCLKNFSKRTVWKCFCTLGISKIKFENLGNNYFLKEIVFQLYFSFMHSLVKI